MDTDESEKSSPNSASLHIDDTSSGQDWPVLILPVVDQSMAMRNFLPQPLVRPGLTSGVKVSLTTQERLCCPVMTYCVRYQWSVQRKYPSVANRDKREYHNMRQSSNKYAPRFLTLELLSCSTDEVLGCHTQA